MDPAEHPRCGVLAVIARGGSNDRSPAAGATRRRAYR
jgi:hypothetical protein